MGDNNPKYTITSDTILWNHFRAGDDKSFSLIYRTYVQQLYKYGIKFTADRELVLDCIQDLFVSLYKHRQNLGETNNIKLYLFISFKRSLVCALRKKSKTQLFPFDQLPFLTVFSSGTEYSESATDMERINRLNKALKTLSPRQKEAIYLRFSN